VSPVKYELCSFIPEDEILHSHRRENLESYIQYNFEKRICLSSHVLLVTLIIISCLSYLHHLKSR
jgi:hypothetical protein